MLVNRRQQKRCRCSAGAAKANMIIGAAKLRLAQGEVSSPARNELASQRLLHWCSLTAPSVFDWSHLSQGLIKDGHKFECGFEFTWSGTQASTI